MDIIEKGFHVGISSVKNLFFFYVMSYLIRALLCDENNPSFGIQLCYKDIDIFSWVLVISDYIASCDYECRILWDIERKLDCCVYYLLFKFHYIGRTIDNLQNMLLCFPRKMVIFIC
jgi:hypothetical protein